MKRYSLGVVVPNLNSIQLLPAHLESMRPWLDLADEVVVVDSQSNDGSLELLQKELPLLHPGARILQHPRGLYQSWNFGIRSLGTKYFYMSTVGDPISRGGIESLLALAEQFSADAVVSKPRFITETGEPLGQIDWPIDDIINTLGLRSPACLHGAGLCLFALVNCTAAILGSSASNLGRTACFQERPFPTGFGTSGDGAWGVMNAPAVRIAVTPEQFSSFREHPKSYSRKEYAVNDLPLKFFAAAREALEKILAGSGPLKDDLIKAGVPRLIGVVEEWLTMQRALEVERGRKIPWSLNPLAWRARLARDRRMSEAQALKRQGLASLGVI